MPSVIETQRLAVRKFEPDEEKAYIALFADVLVSEHLPKRTADEHRKIFTDTLAEDARGTPFSKWAIINKKDGSLIGMGLLRSYNNEAATLEVGYALKAAYWGQGFGTELTEALISYAAGFPDVNSIVAVTTTGNTASQKVLKKAGLIKQGNIVRDNTELAFFKINVK